MENRNVWSYISFQKKKKLTTLFTALHILQTGICVIMKKKKTEGGTGTGFLIIKGLERCNVSKCDTCDSL